MTVNFESTARQRFAEIELVKLSPLIVNPLGLEVIEFTEVPQWENVIHVKLLENILTRKRVTESALRKQQYRPRSLYIERVNFTTDYRVPKAGYITVSDPNTPLSLSSLLNQVNDALGTDVRLTDVDTSLLRMTDPKIIVRIRPDCLYYTGRIIFNIY